ncbi:EAL domain-containing protein [Paraglaciecola sp. L3A3]|uniref:sensor domain-containing diguanylate cyclase n=1 Tax=Paraglaciecola sp. L3A3 TaxID=2686358 RepID=UPI00131CB3E3|nr:EAL domain-containing protein [Paraglaciecola sp. L3A3]
MTSDNIADNLSLEELQELVPQLQEITKKYKHSEVIQKSLFEISELASTINELSSLYPAIQKIIGTFIPAQNFSVAFYEEGSDCIEFVYADQKPAEEIISKNSLNELKETITGYILRTGKYLFLKQETYNEQLAQMSIKSIAAKPVDWIGVPLKRGSQVIGAIAVQSYNESIRFTQEDLEALLFVSQHIVNCVDRVKSRELTEKSFRQRTKQLRLMNEELQEEISERQKVESLQQALFEISELSASTNHNTHNFYSIIHDILARLIGAPSCYISNINEESQTLEFPYYKNELATYIEPRKMGLGLTEYIIRHGTAQLIDSSNVTQLYEAGELSEKICSNMCEKGHSWLGAPLVIDGNISGVIAVQSYTDSKQYTLKDLEFLRFVSHHIAVAFTRKQATEAMQAYNQRLAEEVKQRTQELNSANTFLQKQIEERKLAQLQLEYDTQHDALTGLANRVLFNSRLELAIASKQRYSANHFAVIFIDLDRFKQINDSLGHLAGDAFLKEVANRINSCIRAHDLLARLGGDEFVVLFDNFDAPTDIEEISGRIIESIAKPFKIENKDMYSGASIGITYLDSSYHKADEVLRDADAAMYHAKSLGRARYVIFDKTMREKLLVELEMEEEFRKILQARAFEHYIQPVVDLNTKQVLYEECYIRWQYLSLGKIKREQYWHVAEQCGLTVEMDKYILSNACEMLVAWKNGSAADKNRLVAINLSIHQLTQTSLAKQLVEYCVNSGADPKKLVLEFNENTLNSRSQFLLPAIKILKRAGITLVLDNFGSGLASLSYLYSYPFDYVKVDHHFVKTLPRSERNLKLIQSVLSISSHLKFKLIAEGITTEAQYTLLAKAGCQFGQGKFLQKAEKVEINDGTNNTISA